MPNNVGSSLGGSSLVLHSQQTSFDVRKESDVIALLKIVHQNTLDTDIKNHLRDLIFAYCQNKNDGGMKAIRDAFAPLGVLVVAAGDQSTVASMMSPMQSDKKSSLGIVRPRPAFKAMTSVVQVLPVAEKEITIPRVLPVASATAPMLEPTAPSVVVPASIAYVNPNQRINEIKSIVNQKVGNPVNLIEAHNEIGREYMNALLDAMKKANGGEQGGVAISMERLEKAFVAVQATLVSDTPKSVTPVASPVTVAPVVIETKKEVVVPPPVQEVEQSRTLEVTSVVPDAEITEQHAEPIKISTPTPTPTPTPTVQAIRLAPVSAAPSFAQKNALHSVATDKELQDLQRATHMKNMEQSAEAEQKRIAMLDPLLTPAVTAGLGQLLSEWSLFKSSGIFGTGPSGKDHVLYTKLAPLTMAAVIAGRFEGVTPQIKQSITDYMNGWRYEEEIIHDHQETFEHYLRRVIFHILNKSKQGAR